jgi:hypothetical protein
MYKDNVAALCARWDIKNPIDEKELKIQKLIFFKYGGKPSDGWKLEVEWTKMNRAGRLFLEAMALRRTVVQLDSIRAEAKEFFTPELWDDCTAEHRPLVFGVKEAAIVQIFYR